MLRDELHLLRLCCQHIHHRHFRSGYRLTTRTENNYFCTPLLILLTISHTNSGLCTEYSVCIHCMYTEVSVTRLVNIDKRTQMQPLNFFSGRFPVCCAMVPRRTGFAPLGQSVSSTKVKSQDSRVGIAQLGKAKSEPDNEGINGSRIWPESRRSTRKVVGDDGRPGPQNLTPTRQIRG